MLETSTNAQTAFDRIGSGEQAAVIKRKGAELIGWTCGKTGFLYRDGDSAPPAAGWTNHATVMGYFIHRLLGQKSLYKGREIRGGNHGFLRDFDFAEPERTPESVSYIVPPGSVPPDAYPLPVGLELGYAFRDGWLETSFHFTNPGSENAKLSFGLHPGFAVPEDGSWELYFPAGCYVRHMAPGNFLDGRTEALDFGGGPMPYARENLLGSYLIDLAGVTDPIFQLEGGGRRVVFDFRGVPYMTLWSDGGAFLCVEPCWGLPDSNPQKPFEEKDGIQTVPARGELKASFRMKAELLP